MKFLCSWTIEPKDRNESQRRLNASHDVGGEGIRVVGYWHSVNQLGGWAVLEADTEVALAKWMGRWSDLAPHKGGRTRYRISEAPRTSAR